MDETLKELYDAVRAVMPYLEASSDDDHRTSADMYAKLTAEYRLSRAERLRQQADQLEAKDSAILRLRALMKSFETEDVPK